MTRSASRRHWFRSRQGFHNRMDILRPYNQGILSLGERIGGMDKSTYPGT